MDELVIYSSRPPPGRFYPPVGVRLSHLIVQSYLIRCKDRSGYPLKVLALATGHKV